MVRPITLQYLDFERDPRVVVLQERAELAELHAARAVRELPHVAAPRERGADDHDAVAGDRAARARGGGGALDELALSGNVNVNVNLNVNENADANVPRYIVNENVNV